MIAIGATRTGVTTTNLIKMLLVEWERNRSLGCPVAKEITTVKAKTSKAGNIARDIFKDDSSSHEHANSALLPSAPMLAVQFCPLHCAL
jgi:hypothetical protein